MFPFMRVKWVSVRDAERSPSSMCAHRRCRTIRGFTDETLSRTGNS